MTVSYFWCFLLAQPRVKMALARQRAGGPGRCQAGGRTGQRGNFPLILLPHHLRPPTWAGAADGLTAVQASGPRALPSEPSPPAVSDPGPAAPLLTPVLREEREGRAGGSHRLAVGLQEHAAPVLSSTFPDILEQGPSPEMVGVGPG